MAHMVADIAKGFFSQTAIHARIRDLENKAQLGEYYFAIDLVTGKIDL